MAKGFTHKEGIGFPEILSPVVKYKIIRMVLNLVVQFNWELKKMDVKVVFLHRELNDEGF